MKKIKEMTRGMSAVLVSLCELAVGILLLIDPVGFTSGIVIGLGVLMTVSGLLSAIAYFRSEPQEAVRQQKLARGMCLMAAGLFCAFNSGWFIATFPVLTALYGAAILLLGLVRVQWMVDEIRLKSGKWMWAGLSALLAIAFGAIILCDPFSSSAVLWIFAGISLIAEAALDIIAMVFIRKKKN